MSAPSRFNKAATTIARRFASTLSTPSPLLHPSLPPPKPPTSASRGRTKSSTTLSISSRLFTARQARREPTSAPILPKIHSHTHTQGRRPRSIPPQNTFTEYHSIPSPPIPYLHLTPPSTRFNNIAQSYYTTPEVGSRTLTPTEWAGTGPFDLKPRYAFGSSRVIEKGLNSCVEKERVGNGTISGLAAHLGVTKVLGHGENEVIRGFERELLEERVEDLSRLLSEVGLKNRLEADSAWQGVLARLGDKPKSGFRGVKLEDREMGDKSEMESVMGDLKNLLVKLDGKSKSEIGQGRGRNENRGRMIEIVGPEGEVESVWMDSTQRKRRKKITKHKYQKRRKAQAALRKKLKKD